MVVANALQQEIFLLKRVLYRRFSWIHAGNVHESILLYRAQHREVAVVFGREKDWTSGVFFQPRADSQI
jgi:hypothetical protein